MMVQLFFGLLSLYLLYRFFLHVAENPRMEWLLATVVIILGSAGVYCGCLLLRGLVN